MGQIRCHVLPKGIAGGELVHSVLIRALLRLQLRQFSDEVGHLEYKHASANVLRDLKCTVQSWDDCGFHCIDWLLEVHGQIVEKLADDIIRVIQLNQQVIWLRDVIVLQGRHSQDLRLFQGASQIEVV